MVLATQRDSFRAPPFATVATALVWALSLGTVDAVAHAGRLSRFAPTGAVVAFAVLSAGVIALLLLPLSLAQSALHNWASRGSARRWVCILVEGALLGFVIGGVQDYKTVTSGSRALIALTVVAARVLYARARARSVALGAGFSVSSIGCALLLERALSVREYSWLLLAVDLVAALAFIHVLERRVARAPRRLLFSASLLALVLVVFGPWVARRSSLLRGLLYDASSHGLAHATPLAALISPPAPQPLLGRQACNDPGTARCAGAEIARRTSFSGKAVGSDVLVVSVDALRWDDAPTLARLRAEMGPQLVFSHAISPAPHTAFSFAAMWRGRPLRQVPFGAPAHHVARQASETLAQVLVGRGYRAVFAPGHRYLERKTGVSRGFEQLVEPGFESLLASGKHFPTSSSLGQLLAAARVTKQPLFAWVHAMETHLSYHWDGGVGPKSRAGQRHAARDLDARLAAFVHGFRAERAGRPLLLVVLSDHGEEFNEHGGTAHSSTVYAEQVRVPFVIAGPGLPAGVIDAPVSTAALPRTILDLLGLEQPCSFTVGSLLPCVAQRAACPALSISEYRSANGAIDLVAYAGSRMRLVYDRAHDVPRLFDSERDPYEQDDLLAAMKAPPELGAALRSARAFDDRYCTATPGQ
jgi:hypothetical protein